MQFRKLTDSERRVVDRLLAEDFPGRVAIIEQINQSLVRQIDEDGSLEFDGGAGPIAVSKFRIPVEGEAEDVDGVPIHILLHVVDGRVKELEIYKDDSSTPIKIPEPEEIRLFRPA
jgi:CBS domain containing-hemolysin-like protein